MLTPQRVERVNHIGLVFYENILHGIVCVGHDGDTTVFHNSLVFLPSSRFGIFVSTNTGAGGAANCNALVDAVVARYFAPPGSNSEYHPQTSDAAAVAGTYQSCLREDSTLIRLAALLQQYRIETTANGDISYSSIGVLSNSQSPGNWTVHLHEVSPFVYRNPSGKDFGFDAVNEGMIMETGLLDLERIPWYFTLRFVESMVGMSLLVFIGSLISWPVGAIARRYRGKGPVSTLRNRKRLTLAYTVMLLDVLALVGVGIILSRSSDLTVFNASLDRWLITIYTMAWIGVVGTLPVVWIALRLWRERSQRFWHRAHYTVLAFSTVNVASFFIIWHIAGTTLNY
jgi:hypothetical protein